MNRATLLITLLTSLTVVAYCEAQSRKNPELFRVPAIRSSWDDLMQGIKTPNDWQQRRQVLRQRYLDLIRDQHKPAKPPLKLKVHETVVVDDTYTRKLISYNVEEDERAFAFLGIPLERDGKGQSQKQVDIRDVRGDSHRNRGFSIGSKLPAMVTLHGTFAQGKQRAAGLVDNPDKAYLDHLCRRGYVVIAPEHFVSGHRTPAEGPYETGRFYEKHPEWTAVGKFTYEHSIAIDVLETLDEVDASQIGVLGHSLGGHGTIFLAAYDERVKAAACNCGATFFRHNPRAEAWARDHWYIYFKHIRPGLLRGEMPPIDFHEIIALIAPRAFLDLSGMNDGPPGTQRQRILMLTRVMDVYELVQAPQNFAFYVHGRGHSVEHESRQLMYGWMDTHLKPPELTATHLVTD